MTETSSPTTQTVRRQKGTNDLPVQLSGAWTFSTTDPSTFQAQPEYPGFFSSSTQLTEIQPDALSRSLWSEVAHGVLVKLLSLERAKPLRALLVRKAETAETDKAQEWSLAGLALAFSPMAPIEFREWFAIMTALSSEAEVLGIPSRFVTVVDIPDVHVWKNRSATLAAIRKSAEGE